MQNTTTQSLTTTRVAVALFATAFVAAAAVAGTQLFKPQPKRPIIGQATTRNLLADTQRKVDSAIPANLISFTELAGAIPESLDESSNWYSGATADSAQTEYEIKDTNNGSLSAINRRNNFQVKQTGATVQFQPRETNLLSWSATFDFQGISKGESRAITSKSAPAAIKEQYSVRRVHDGVAVQYDNTSQGWRDTYTIEKKPTGDGALAVDLRLTTNGVDATLDSEKNEIIFTDTAMQQAVLRYTDLKAKDRDGTVLPATMELKDTRVRLVIDDTNAVYPVTIDPIAETPEWHEYGEEYMGLGTRVASAGDVNNDGYDDTVIAAQGFNAAAGGEGKTFVYHGSAIGLSSSPAWSATGDEFYAHFGGSIASGDVNGDGYSDLLVGAPGQAVDADPIDGWDIITDASDGAASLYLGSASGLLSTPAWTAQGNEEREYFGYSVAIGNLNADAYSDAIVTAPGYDSGSVYSAGRMSIYLGSATGLPATPTMSVEGAYEAQELGKYMDIAGDVNGDSYQDIVISGNVETGDPQEGKGQVFLYHGNASGVDLSAHTTIIGEQVNSLFGYTLSGAGDVNNDGYDDIIVGASEYSGDLSVQGKVYLYPGASDGVSIVPLWTAQGNRNSAAFGKSVSAAGDVNHDGYDDVLVGAPEIDNDIGSMVGTAYLYYGTLTGLNATSGWQAEGMQTDERFGYAVSGAGDINGDGYADMIISAPYYDIGGDSNAGRVSVYYGVNEPLDACLTTTWAAEGSQSGALSGWKVTSAGDVNGDGATDVLVTMPAYDHGQANEGLVMIHYGEHIGVSPMSDWFAEGNAENLLFGFSAAAAGDVNNDGYDDILVGTPAYSGSLTNEGLMMLYLGSASGLHLSPDWSWTGGQAEARLGASLAGVGDVNNDGFDDVAVGVPLYDDGEIDEGDVLVFTGNASSLLTGPVWRGEMDQAGAHFGASVAGAGDVNEDGFADIIIGAPLYDDPEIDQGIAFIYYGMASGMEAAPTWYAKVNESNAKFGFSVAGLGDVNGDGHADVAVGGPLFDDEAYHPGAYNDSGVWVAYQGTGTEMPAYPAYGIRGNQNYNWLGFSIASAGDVNGDGYDDMIAGAPLVSSGQLFEGVGSVYLGSSTGLALTPEKYVPGDQVGALAGWSVAPAGDVDANGKADLLVGMPYLDIGGLTNAGSVTLLRSVCE